MASNIHIGIVTKFDILVPLFTVASMRIVGGVGSTVLANFADDAIELTVDLSDFGGGEFVFAVIDSVLLVVL